MKKILEKHVEQPNVKYAKSLGILVVKQTHAGARSHPDRALYYPGGHLLQIEYKAPGELPTKLQAETITRLRVLGFDVQVVDNEQWGRSLIDARMGCSDNGMRQYARQFDIFTQQCLVRTLAKKKRKNEIS